MVWQNHKLYQSSTGEHALKAITIAKGVISFRMIYNLRNQTSVAKYIHDMPHTNNSFPLADLFCLMTCDGFQAVSVTIIF